MSRLVLLLVLLALLGPVFAAAAKGKEDLTTIVSSETELDFTRLRALAHSPDAEPWHHSSDLFFAVHSGKTAYSVVDSVKSTEG